MAVKYNDVKDALEKQPFTDEELETISAVEKYIDDRVNKEFDNSAIWFDLRIIRFESGVAGRETPNFKTTRKLLMTKELERRYTDNEWKIATDNMDSAWILKGK